MSLETIRNMHDILLHVERFSMNTPLIEYLAGRNSASMSVDEFLEEVKRRSAGLMKENLQKKHVGIIGRNSAGWITAFCAAANIGATAVLMNPDLNTGEIDRAVRDTDIAGLFYDEDMEERIKRYIERDDYATFCIQQKCDNAEIHDLISPPDSQLEDIMCILYTSGTTGEQKAVMLSNRAVIAGISHYLETVLKDTAVHLTVMPLHHAGALFTGLAALFKENCVLGVIDGPMKLKRGIEQIRPNSMFAVPSLLQSIEHELSKKNRTGYSEWGESLKYIVCGGAQLPAALIPTFRERNITVYNIYGATESTVGVIVHDATREPPSILGKPMNAEAKIENGELLLRGKTIMTGYYHDQAATEETLKDGWYHTGDLASIDEDGYYYLTGRKKNLIILSNGENISPEELEKYLGVSPDILEVIVTEYQDALWAAVWPDYPDGSRDKEKEFIRQRIREFVKEYNDRMPTYKQIYDLKFWDTPLPKNATGKILRNQIKI